MAYLEFGGLKRVLQEHCDGHGTDPTAHRRDGGGYLTYGVEINVSHQFAGRQPVSAHIDHHGPRADHIRFEKPSLTDGNNHDVGGSRNRWQVLAAAMADGDGSVGPS